MEALQIYWWCIISLLGGLLVMMLFVQGGQTLLCGTRDAEARTLQVNALGRKWELTYTTLVVFGGAFFASFPLFYSTCFGGAYWLWMLILVSFVVQAVSYEFRRKPGNLYGTGTYDTLLLINGCVGCILLGVAVGMMFFGGDFTIGKANILDAGAPAISVWGAAHGLEAIGHWRCLLLGVTVLLLARTNAALFYDYSIDAGDRMAQRQRRRALLNGGVFVVAFLAFVAVLLTSDSYAPDASGHIVAVPYGYAAAMTQMWWIGLMFVVGVLMVLYGLGKTALVPGYRHAFRWTASGTAVTVMALLLLLGLSGGAYLPSLTSPESSLTIANSSATKTTLTVMAIVSALVPIVVGYIWVVWRKLTTPPLTPAEVDNSHESY